MTVYYIDPTNCADDTATGLKYTGMTADAGTDATKIIDAGLDGMVIPNGSFVWNATRNLGALTTAWDDGTNTLTVAIAGQAQNDSYYIITPWKISPSVLPTCSRPWTSTYRNRRKSSWLEIRKNRRQWNY